MINSSQQYRRLSLFLLVVAIGCLYFADIEIYAVEPWSELKRMMWGWLQPDMTAFNYLLPAVAQTLAFALLSVSIAAFLGLLLAMFYRHRVVRMVSSSIRAVHELFWGLIFMQVFGLSATTGLLAILLPFAGTFAKVYAEIFEQQSKTSLNTLSPKASRISRLSYTLLPLSWPAMISYTRYRFECALRSSTILGFIGLPTLGFYLETAFSQGRYGEAALLLAVFYGLIASIRFWLKAKLLPIYWLVAIFILPESPPTQSSLWTFISHDIWPRALLEGQWGLALDWYRQQLLGVALPAVKDTLILSQIALALSGLLALGLYGWASPILVHRSIYRLGHFALLVMRSTPEMLLAFVLLLLLGPSMLPAAIALSLHNGGLIAYLLAKQSEHLSWRADAPKGLNRYLYELNPRLYPQFLSLLLYRWEVIMRESAILGMLGITSLGFYIDSAFEDIRYDRAAFLILITALLNIAVDSLARRLRQRCQLDTSTPI